MKFPIVGVAVVLAAGLAGTASLAQVQPSGPVPPPPPTPIVSPVPTPPGGSIPANVVPTLPPPTTPAPPERGRGRRRGAVPGASPVSAASARPGTPAPPQFTNLDGVWEVQVQPGARTFYSHLYLKQNPDNTLTGYWETDKKAKLPVSGSFDGKQFKITVQDGKSQDTFAGYEDNFSDMVGLLEMGNAKQPVAFTAAHRQKSGSFLKNLNIGAPTGIGGSSGTGGL